MSILGRIRGALSGSKPVHRTVAIRVAPETIWEMPLPSGYDGAGQSHEWIINRIRGAKRWGDLFTDDEPENWREMEMEIREYE